MKYLLTLDVGTTAVKAGVFSQELYPEGFVIKEYTLYTPEKGIVELDPKIYWESAADAIREVVELSKINTYDIAAITCTTQGETLIPVDKEGNPLRNAIVWLDSRSEKESEYITKEFTKEIFYSVTGIPEVSPLCPISKVLWLKNNQPGIYEQAHKILLLEDYLIMKFTGRFVSNPALMCSTGYFNITENVLWMGMLDYCGIDPGKFPEVLPSGTKAGGLTSEAAAACGLREGITVSTGAMDQVASAVGSGNILSGMVSETTGTAQVVAATCSMPDLGRWTPVTVYSHAIKGKYLLINYSQTAGIILKWFRDEFCKDLMSSGGNAFNAMDRIAEGIAPLSNGLVLFPHFTGMQIPEVNPRTRGVFFGVGLDTGRGHFIRAIMEAVGYMLRENIEALDVIGVKPKSIFSLGGGAKSHLWSRIKADICNMEIVSLDRDESTSIGAAILGGLASGLFDSIDNACRLLDRKGSIKPDVDTVRIYESGYIRYKEMYESFKGLF